MPSLQVNFVEYGNNEIIGWIRTELISPHLISVRLTERRSKNGDSVKRVAYLLDLNTISMGAVLISTVKADKTTDGLFSQSDENY